jgi:hypothetical protein
MYMLVSCHQNAGQNQDIETSNKISEHVSVQIIGNNSNKSKFHSGGN